MQLIKTVGIGARKDMLWRAEYILDTTFIHKNIVSLKVTISYQKRNKGYLISILRKLVNSLKKFISVHCRCIDTYNLKKYIYLYIYIYIACYAKISCRHIRELMQKMELLDNQKTQY